jgi:hypothetical protein
MLHLLYLFYHNYQVSNNIWLFNFVIGWWGPSVLFPRHCAKVCSNRFGHCRISRWPSSSWVVQPAFTCFHLERIPPEISLGHDVLYGTIPLRQRRFLLNYPNSAAVKKKIFGYFRNYYFKVQKEWIVINCLHLANLLNQAKNVKNYLIPYFTFSYFQIPYLTNLMFYKFRFWNSRLFYWFVHSWSPWLGNQLSWLLIQIHPFRRTTLHQMMFYSILFR